MVEFEWDISKDRAEFIAEVTNSTRRQQFLARAELENGDFDEYLKELNRYEAALRSLLMETKTQAQRKDIEEVDTDRLQKVEGKIKKIEVVKNNVRNDRRGVLENLEEADEAIQNLRIDMGLALGKTEDEDLGPEDLYE